MNFNRVYFLRFCTKCIHDFQNTYWTHNGIVFDKCHKNCQTNHVQDKACSKRLRKTSWREDRALLRLLQQFPFSNSTVIKHRWIPNRPLPNRTVRYRLRVSCYHAYRPIRRPILTPGQKAVHFNWCQQRRNGNICLGEKSIDRMEVDFFLHMTERSKLNDYNFHFLVCCW